MRKTKEAAPAAADDAEMTKTEKRKLVRAIADSLPPDITKVEARSLIKDPKQFALFLAEVWSLYRQSLATASAAARRFLALPKPGETFSLEMDADDPEYSPDDQPRRYGYGGEWKFRGQRLVGKITGSFQLVPVQIPDRDAALAESIKAAIVAQAPGASIPSGQWLEVFRWKYRPQRGVGVLDSSWEGPNDHRSFPYLSAHGTPLFLSVDTPIQLSGWLWLVQVESTGVCRSHHSE